LSRFQCVNWISWKHLVAIAVVVIGFLASNALIGLVGNTAKTFVFNCTKEYLASNALIGLVGNTILLNPEPQAPNSRFQCVNWISWKHPATGGLVKIFILASNALIGLVGNKAGGVTLPQDTLSLPMR